MEENGLHLVLRHRWRQGEDMRTRWTSEDKGWEGWVNIQCSSWVSFLGYTSEVLDWATPVYPHDPRTPERLGTTLLDRSGEIPVLQLIQRL